MLEKFALTEEQQLRAITARQFSQAENLKEQQESLIKIIESLRKEGKTEETKAVMDEAIALGIFEQDGETIKKKKGKEKSRIGKGFINRLVEQFK